MSWHEQVLQGAGDRAFHCVGRLKAKELFNKLLIVTAEWRTVQEITGGWRGRKHLDPLF